MWATEMPFDNKASAVTGTLPFAIRLLTPLSLVGMWVLSTAGQHIPTLHFT